MFLDLEPGTEVAAPAVASRAVDFESAPIKSTPPKPTSAPRAAPDFE
jgi:hypothetical protein